MNDQAQADTVLVPLDGSALAEQVLPYARALAGPGGEVVLLQVVPDPEPIRGLLGNIVAGPDEVLDRYKEAARSYLAGAAKHLGEGVTTRSVVVAGYAEEQIVAVATAQNIGLIALASHGRGAVGRWVFGSVADKVARTSPVPVLIVHPRHEEEAPAPVAIARLVVPLDGSDLAEAALPVAAAYARRLRVPVHLLRAVDMAALLPPLSPGPVPEFPVTPDLYDQIYGDVQAEAERSLAGAAAQLEQAGATVTKRVLVGPVVPSIADAAEPGDLLILTSHGRGGVERWLLGSVAERLIRTSPTPVILVPAAPRTAALQSDTTQPA
jgi:nucleotide-binding universal stress UspA family protein